MESNKKEVRDSNKRKTNAYIYYAIAIIFLLPSFFVIYKRRGIIIENLKSESSGQLAVAAIILIAFFAVSFVKHRNKKISNHGVKRDAK
jgi:Ca2+/H+ antiporter